MSHLSRFLLAALYGLLALSVPLGSGAAESAAERFVSVTGTGEVRAAPDVATIRVGATTEAETAARALAGNSERMTALLETLKNLGITEDRVQTSESSLSPLYDRSGGTREITGYAATNEVEIETDDLAGLGALLDRVTSAGANRILNLRFGVRDADRLMDNARRAAMADARRKARLYAEAADARLGRVIEIAEGAPAPFPVMRTFAQESAAVPIAPGEERLRISVSVTYALE